MSYKELSKKEKIIFIWIRHLRFEFIDNNHWNGYIKVINEMINPMEIMFRENKYEDIIELCHIATEINKKKYWPVIKENFGLYFFDNNYKITIKG